MAWYVVCAFAISLEFGPNKSFHEMKPILIVQRKLNFNVYRDAALHCLGYFSKKIENTV